MRSPIRVSMLAILVVAPLALARPVHAETGRDAFYLRVGGVSEGQQHTLKRGFEIGAGYDWPLHDQLYLGMGMAIANDGAAGDSDARAISLEGHGRWLLTKTRVRPLLELGLGYYWIDVHSTGFIGARKDGGAPGAWFGLGAETGISSGLSARLGIAYHLIAQSITVSGGNLEDYVATGLTLAYGPPR